MSEWFKELVLKTSDSARGRGFESHLLRSKQPLLLSEGGSIYLFDLAVFGEVPKLAEGAPLERE